MTEQQQAAMRQALELWDKGLVIPPASSVHKAFRRALEQQPADEPVAWVDLLKEAEQIVRGKFLWKRFIDGTPLANDVPCWMADFAQQYTSPQPSAWVGLTFDMIEECFGDGGGTDEHGQIILPSAQWLHDFARAIEAKLREKNGGR